MSRPLRAAAALLVMSVVGAGCLRPSIPPTPEELRSESELECAVRYHRFNTTCKRADWYERTGLESQALKSYEQALDTLAEIKKIDLFWNAAPIRERELVTRNKVERLKDTIRMRDLRQSEALERFIAAHAAAPMAAGPYADLGDFYFNEHEYQDAMVQYREAILREPSNVEVLIRMAQVFSRMGNFEKARQIYAQILDVNPDLAAVHYNLGGIYFRMQKPTFALREYTRALELEPGSVHTLNALGVTCKQLKHYDEAEGYFKKAIQVNPDYAPAYYNLGLVFMEKHNYPNATSYLQRAIDLFGPRSPRGRAIAELIRNRRRAR